MTNRSARDVGKIPSASGLTRNTSPFSASASEPGPTSRTDSIQTTLERAGAGMLQGNINDMSRGVNNNTQRLPSIHSTAQYQTAHWQQPPIGQQQAQQQQGTAISTPTLSETVGYGVANPDEPTLAAIKAVQSALSKSPLQTFIIQFGATARFPTKISLAIASKAQYATVDLNVLIPSIFLGCLEIENPIEIDELIEGSPLTTASGSERASSVSATVIIRAPYLPMAGQTYPRMGGGGRYVGQQSQMGQQVPQQMPQMPTHADQQIQMERMHLERMQQQQIQMQQRHMQEQHAVLGGQQQQQYQYPLSVLRNMSSMQRRKMAMDLEVTEAILMNELNRLSYLDAQSPMAGATTPAPGVQEPYGYQNVDRNPFYHPGFFRAYPHLTKKIERADTRKEAAKRKREEKQLDESAKSYKRDRTEKTHTGASLMLEPTTPKREKVSDIPEDKHDSLSNADIESLPVVGARGDKKHLSPQGALKLYHHQQQQQQRRKTDG